jgi:polar amino acid transport system substrate-binding protein
MHKFRKIIRKKISKSEIFYKIVLLILLTIILLWYSKKFFYPFIPLKNQINFAVLSKNFPFSYKNKNDILEGIDIDIIYEIMKRLDKRYEINYLPEEEFINNYKKKRYDCFFCGISNIRKKIKGNALISYPYIKSNIIMAINKKDMRHMPISSSNFTKLKIGVLKNTLLNIILEKNKNNKILKFDNISDGLISLEKEDIEYLLLNAKCALKIEENKNFKKYFKITEIKVKENIAYFFINDESFNLLNIINMTLKEMDRDGTINKIKEKWNIF